MWNAFSGYGDIYGSLPSMKKVERVMLYLLAKNEFEHEQEVARERELDEMKREQARNRH